MASVFLQAIIIFRCQDLFSKHFGGDECYWNRGGEDFPSLESCFFIHPVTKLSLKVSDGLRITNRYVYISRKEST